MGQQASAPQSPVSSRDKLADKEAQAEPKGEAEAEEDGDDDTSQVQSDTQQTEKDVKPIPKETPLPTTSAKQELPRKGQTEDSTSQKEEEQEDEEEGEEEEPITPGFQFVLDHIYPDREEYLEQWPEDRERENIFLGTEQLSFAWGEIGKPKERIAQLEVLEVEKSLPPKPSAFERYAKEVQEALDGKNHSLYPHQIEALKNIHKTLDAPGKVALVVLPTGAGKSTIAVLSAYVLKADRVLVVTPSKEIACQLTFDFCGTRAVAQMANVATFGNLPLDFWEKNKDLNDAEDKEEVKKRKAGNQHQKRPCVERVGIFPPYSLAFDPRVLLATEPLPMERLRESPLKLFVINAHKFMKAGKLEQIPRDMFDYVIVDEAHHFDPDGNTWKKISDHFHKSRQLFLTATPTHGKNSLIGTRGLEVAFKLSLSEAVEKKIIRKMELDVVRDDANSKREIALAVGRKVIEHLIEHDGQDDDPKHRHQAMVLVENSTETADEVAGWLNSLFPPGLKEPMCVAYHSKIGSKASETLLEQFRDLRIRILVVCGRLLEGFDQVNVSVVAILRPVKAPVMFTQFVGRAIRRFRPGKDDVTGWVVTHESYEQEGNFKCWRAQKPFK